MAPFSFKNTKFWLDILVLSIFWFLSFSIPPEYTIFNLVSWSVFFKIIALLATLEVTGFFAIFFLSERSSIMFQGFFGGFVSSTATFLHFTQGAEFEQDHPRSVSRALLLASMAMLLEGIFFIFTLSPKDTLILSRPFIIQFLVLLIMVVALKSKNFPEKPSSESKIKLKEMIIWKNVLKFSLLMVALIFAMRFLTVNLSVSPVLSSFLMSLFEAHGVLAAALSEFGQTQNSNTAQEILMAILVGNVISKTFFVLRGRNKSIRGPVLFSLYFSLSWALLSHLI